MAQTEFLRARSGFAPIGEDIVGRLRASSDATKTGVTIAAEMAAKLKGIPGIRGIHILSDGCEPLVGRLIEEARLA
jgi:hypothetical protein